MIVDDEPFIRQGLKILIDWEQYGFLISGEAGTGMEAIELMEREDFDLLITDIKMPKMSGIELIEYTYNNISKNIRFIILSGFYEFEYTKKAIKYDVSDYVLKPVQREDLIRALEDYKEQYKKRMKEQNMVEFSEKIVFDRNLSILLKGKYDKEAYDYVVNHLTDSKDIRYINMDFDHSLEPFTELCDKAKRKAQGTLYNSLKDYLKNYWYHSYIDINNSDNDYSVGFIYARNLAKLTGLDEKNYIYNLYRALSSQVPYKFVMYIGQKVDDIQNLSESYKSAIIAKSFQVFSEGKDISYYDEIKSLINTEKTPVDKEIMDDLIRAIEENNSKAIDIKIKAISEHFKELVASPDIININLNYLRFNLINIAKELDPNFDQGEVYEIITQGSYNELTVMGSINHFRKFAHEFSNYLNQQRKYSFGGVLSDVEKEITEHYMNNLSLKSLGEKYYINSAYLGRIFKKQYGIPFKDYLNNYRIERATDLLLRTNDKIYTVANAVGFNNTDYFINKFVQSKGVTPLQYRKQVSKGNLE